MKSFDLHNNIKKYKWYLLQTPTSFIKVGVRFFFKREFFVGKGPRVRGAVFSCSEVDVYEPQVDVAPFWKSIYLKDLAYICQPGYFQLH